MTSFATGFTWSTNMQGLYLEPLFPEGPVSHERSKIQVNYSVYGIIRRIPFAQVLLLIVLSVAAINCSLCDTFLLLSGLVDAAKNALPRAFIWR